MSSALDRPRRNNLPSRAIIYMGEEEHNVSVKNISINGLLVQLNSNRDDVDIKYIFNHLLVSTIIDIYLPEMRLAGEVQIVRADMEGDHILLALEFRNMAFDIDERLNRRKAYRKNMSYTSRGHACGFPNSWNFGFKRVFTCSLKADFTLSMHSSIASLNWKNVS